jgi:hypothetical protein
MADMSLTDLRQRSKGASDYVTLADAVGAIRAAGRLPSSVSDTSVLGYGICVTGTDVDAMDAWDNRDSDPKAWTAEVRRLGYELSMMVQAIKGRGNGGGRPSDEALQATIAPGAIIPTRSSARSGHRLRSRLRTTRASMPSPMAWSRSVDCQTTRHAPLFSASPTAC